MSSFSKNEENYIEHEVKIRLSDTRFQNVDRAIDRLDASIKHLDNKLDVNIMHLDNKIDATIKHLDNKFMLMFSIILGSIWLPAILHYLHVA